MIPIKEESDNDNYWLYQALKILLSDGKLSNEIAKEAINYIVNEYSNDEIKKQWLHEIS